MATATVKPEIGALLRGWRERRRLSQLEVALRAGISARHLSFVETGRSKPGREMLLAVLQELDVPFRERNRVLLDAGHAPAFAERPLEHADLAPVREALERILAAHEPNPAVVFDRGWNLVAANSVMSAIARAADIDPALLEPPVNVLRVGLHPRGLAPLMVNLAQWRGHFIERLERQVAMTGDSELAALLDEVAGYAEPGVRRDAHADRAGTEILGPLRVRAPDGDELAFFGMFATFDTPFEVTTSELAIELLFPADQRTADTMKSFADDPGGARWTRTRGRRSG
jgi:transcriptional regulator with XRE-family HTH domain